jgi:hypothetical protein
MTTYLVQNIHMKSKGLMENVVVVVRMQRFFRLTTATAETLKLSVLTPSVLRVWYQFLDSKKGI